MLKLLIDKQEVSLSVDTNLDLYSYNPFFDRKSDYTYDIDVDLKVAQNARIYKHINRLNIRDHPKNRTAELYDGSKLLLYGTEIILSLDDDIAKIQLVSGNSELNYLAASKKTRMRDLDLGAITLNATTAMNSLYSTSDSCMFVCPPCAKVWKKFGFSWWYDNGTANGKLYNNLSRPYYQNKNEKQENLLNWGDGANLRPMVYLCVLVEKIVKAMGYDVVSNVIRTKPMFKQVYIVNSTPTDKINEMVPNWLVNDFLDQVEKWCNVLFLIDHATNTCKIVDVYDFYKTNATTVYISKEHVIDATEKNYNADKVSVMQYKNVRYNVPGNEFYKYGVMDDNVRSACELVDYYDDASDLTGFAHENFYNRMVILKARNSGKEFVVSKRYDHSRNYYYLQPIDYIGQIKDDNSDDTVSFNIVPAPMVALSLYGFYLYEGTNSNSGGGYCPFFSLIPYAMDQVTEDEISENRGLNEFITGGMSEVAVPSTMFVANYVGIQQCYWPFVLETQWQAVNKLKWPLSLSVGQFVGFGASDYPYYAADNNMHLEYDLSIKSLYSRIYSKNETFDTSEEIVVRFYTDKILDPKKVFIVANTRFCCRYIKYKVSAQGLLREAEGHFYPKK